MDNYGRRCISFRNLHPAGERLAPCKRLPICVHGRLSAVQLPFLGSSLLPGHGGKTRIRSPMLSIALQLYTVRHQLAADFSGTLRRVRDIGYRAVETAPFPAHVSAAMAGELLKSFELEVIAMHCDLPIGPTLKQVLEMASALNCRGMIWHGWPRSEEFASLAAEFAER